MNLRQCCLEDCAFTYNYKQHLPVEITAANLIHKHHFSVQVRIWENKDKYLNSVEAKSKKTKNPGT